MRIISTAETTPFLEVLTRAYKRPVMLALNQASMKAQTSPDWTQTLFIDDTGVGIGATYEALAAHSPCLRGEYIWILDDDDTCIRPELVEELKAIVKSDNPGVIVVKMDHGPLGVLPSGKYWQHSPVGGRIGVSAVIVRRDIWQYHAPAFLPGQYHSDFRFITSLFEEQPSIYWFDVVASRVQRISKGEPE
jgi:hypothetical protein